MDILVISENKILQFIEEFFNHKKINFFIARGSIHCQSILNTKKIQRILFFYTSSSEVSKNRATGIDFWLIT